VPQGAVLSPTLYNLYTHDIPLQGNHSTAQFADDTAIFKSGLELRPIISCLQNAATKVDDYMKKWKVCINGEKTSALFITNRISQEIPTGPINIFNADVNWNDHLKYLGVLIDKKLTFQCHIEQVIEKANVAIKLLYPLINRKSSLHVDNKILIYKLAIRPILTYALPALQGIAPTHIAKLQRTQNKCLKMILNKPWFESSQLIHDLTGTPYIAEYIAKLTNNFLAKLS
jgi:hypothetical protein